MYAKHQIDVKKDVESSLCDWFVWRRGSLQICLRSQCDDESVRNKKFEKVYGFRWVIYIKVFYFGTFSAGKKLDCNIMQGNSPSAPAWGSGSVSEPSSRSESISFLFSSRSTSLSLSISPSSSSTDAPNSSSRSTFGCWEQMRLKKIEGHFWWNLKNQNSKTTQSILTK